MEQPTKIVVNQRLNVQGNNCTVLWIGELPKIEGIRLGIEWDNPSLGKHSGNYKGHQYFQPTQSNSCSFIKYPKTIKYQDGAINLGISLSEAIKDKYMETDVKEMKYDLANSKVKIETCGWEKTQALFADTQSLSVVSVEGLLVSWINYGNEVYNLIPNAESLDLSKTLVSSWPSIFELVKTLPNLIRLRLDGLRFQPFVVYNNLDYINSFKNIKSLFLNKCRITEKQIIELSSALVNLKELEICDNDLTRIPYIKESTQDVWFSKLEILNLQSNKITGIDEESLEGLKYFPSLVHVDISFNPLKKFGLLEDKTPLSNILKRITCQFTLLEDFEQISHLYLKFPKLEHLQILETPFTNIKAKELIKSFLPKNSQFTFGPRGLIISMIPTLIQLNQSKILKQERVDSELYYINQICLHQRSQLDQKQFNLYHPQFENLIKKYDITITVPNLNPIPSTLANSRVLSISIKGFNYPPNQNNLNDTTQLFGIKEILINANIRSVKLAIAKLFKLKPTANIAIYAIFQSNDPSSSPHIVELDNPTRQLVGFYEVSSNDTIWCWIK